MNIFLVGFMGSGKSTIGKLLAQQLKMNFSDLDHIIEDNEKKKVSDIFKDMGEPKFRELEKEFIKKISAKDNQVVALGGGAPCFHNNMEYINKKGLSVYLKMSVEAIKDRLLQLSPQAIASRPLIANKSENELSEFIQATLGKREIYYNKAKLIVSNEEHDASVAVIRIIHALELYSS
jgi:shikimate kinase